MSGTRPAVVVTVIATGLILGATLPPAFGPQGEVTQACLLLCGDRGLADFLVNIVLYTPLGVGLALLGARLRLALLVPFFLAAGIEALQVVVPGRDSSAGDVVANTLGALLGWWLVGGARFWLRPPARLAAWLPFAWAIVVSTAAGVTGYLFRPSLPPGDWYGQWTPRFANQEAYEGTIISAKIGTLATPSRRHPQSDSLRALLRSGAPLEVTAVAGPPPPGLATIYSIANQDQLMVVSIGADRADMRLSHRLRAHDARMDAPDIHLHQWASDVTVGDTITFRLQFAAGGLCFSLDLRGQCRLRYSVARGWGLLLWLSDAPPWLWTLLDVSWIAAWFVPLGIWFPRNHARKIPSWAAAGVLAAAGLMLVASAGGLDPAGWETLLGIGVGLTGGVPLGTLGDLQPSQVLR